MTDISLIATLIDTYLVLRYPKRVANVTVSGVVGSKKYLSVVKFKWNFCVSLGVLKKHKN